MQNTFILNFVAASRGYKTSLGEWRVLRGRGRRLSVLQLISAAIVAFLMLPLVYLGIRALGAGEDGLEYLLRERTFRILLNSLQLVIFVTISAVLIGVPFAWLTSRTDLPHPKIWLILGLLTMVIPSYLGAVTFLSAFGPRGLLQGVLEPALGIERLPDIRGLFGAWLTITLFTYPFVVLPVRAALLNIDSALEEAGRSLGLSRWNGFRRIILPQLRPAIATGALLTAMYTLSDFGAVATMNYNAFTRAIFLQYTNSFSRERAALLALVLVVIVVILFTIERWIAFSYRNYRTSATTKRPQKLLPLGKWKLPALVFCGALIALGVGVPLVVMGIWLTTRVYLDSVPVEMSELMWNTVSVSGVAAVVIMLLAVPLAMIAVRSVSRFNRWLIRLSYLGYVLPGIVIALSLVFFASRYALEIYQTSIVLIAGYCMRFIPFSIGTTRSALTQINPHLEEAARSLGIPSWKATLRVTVPLARAGILAGAALVFLNVMKELPITLILRPIGFRTFSIRIWQSYQEAMLVLIGQPGFLLVIISAIALAIILWREKTISG